MFSFLFLPQYTYSSVKEGYELQVKCGKQCDEKFKGKYGSEGVEVKNEKGFTVFKHRNHYNKKLNKCFQLIETSHCNKEGVVETKIQELSDINENKIYGRIINFLNTHRVFECFVSKTGCKSEEEWDLLIKFYMEE